MGLLYRYKTLMSFSNIKCVLLASYFIIFSFLMEGNIRNNLYISAVALRQFPRKLHFLELLFETDEIINLLKWDREYFK